MLMVILALETSCDETATSVVEDGKKVLSHVLASSAEMHTKTGGIIPEVAAREQLKSILPVIKEALKKSNLYNSTSKHRLPSSTIHCPDIDAIAVTYGPGLIGSLLVGVETAKTLAYAWNKPLIPVNHLIGHIYANFLETQNSNLQTNEPQFPALALLVSGGHTDLILMQDHKNIAWIGGTRDDAAGEAFDKTARLLGLGYPGGPAISRLSDEWRLENGDKKLTLFPRPMVDENNYDWSFSGLKTAVVREINNLTSHSSLSTPMLAAEIQEAIVDSLVIKLIRAIKEFQPKSVLLGGGVAANQRLREKLQLKIENLKLKINLFMPPPIFCTDNASMIAAAAFYHYNPMPWDKVEARPELTITGEV